MAELLPVEGQELDPESEVLRVVRVKTMFIPEGAMLPTLEAFRPSREDEEEAKERGKPVRVSVWNKQLTTIEEAKGFRNTEDPLRVFGSLAGAIKEVGLNFNEIRIRVVADPLEPHLGSGAIGHCGIEGLDRLPGSAKVRHKELLDEIAKVFNINY